MEVVEVISKAHFTDTRIGAVSRKQRLRIYKAFAEELQALDLVEIVSPNVASAAQSQQTAPLGAGGGESPALSPAAQASPETIVTSQESNPDGESSPSTTATVSAQEQTLSTPATASGGMSTKNQSEHPASRANSGRKTKVRRVVTD